MHEMTISCKDTLPHRNHLGLKCHRIVDVFRFEAQSCPPYPGGSLGHSSGVEAVRKCGKEVCDSSGFAGSFWEGSYA